MPSKYKVVVAERAANQLLGHVRFLANVSPAAAHRLRNEFVETIRQLESNPLQFQQDLNIPGYRLALFAKRYQIHYTIEEKVIFVDAVRDCRQTEK